MFKLNQEVHKTSALVLIGALLMGSAVLWKEQQRDDGLDRAVSTTVDTTTIQSVLSLLRQMMKHVSVLKVHKKHPNSPS